MPQRSTLGLIGPYWVRLQDGCTPDSWAHNIQKADRHSISLYRVPQRSRGPYWVKSVSLGDPKINVHKGSICHKNVIHLKDDPNFIRKLFSVTRKIVLATENMLHVMHTVLLVIGGTILFT